MPFVFLLLFALICLQSSWPECDRLTPPQSGLLLGALVLVSWLSAEMIALAFSWQMVRHPERRSSLLRGSLRWRKYHFIGLLVSYLGGVYLLGWGFLLFTTMNAWLPDAYRQNENTGVVQVREGEAPAEPGDQAPQEPRLRETESTQNPPPLFQLCLMLPFFVALIASWERFYTIEKTAYEQMHDDDRYVPKWSYLLMQIRHQFFLVLPPIAVTVLLQLTYPLYAGDAGAGYVPVVVIVAIMAAAFILMPVLLRCFLGLKPLPPGDLRDRLENTARRLKFRYSNVLVWHTRHQFANAMVTGFVPWIRYIVLTDRLIEELDPDEIEAVFGHEVGHIKHHHLLFYLAFFLTSFALLGLIWDVLKSWITQDDIRAAIQSTPHLGGWWHALVTVGTFGKLGLLVAYTVLIFGFLSRRCERQADLFGASTVSIDAFVSALEKVAAINGIARDRGSWQHPTIAQRVDFLEQVRNHPDQALRFQRDLAMLKWCYFAVLGLFLAVLFGIEEIDHDKILNLIKDF
jgi:STE24 endopeptidase